MRLGFGKSFDSLIMYDGLVHPHGTLRAEEISCNFGDGHGLRCAKIWNDFFLFQDISDESV